MSPAGGRAPHEPLTRRWVGVLERRGRFWSVTPIFQRSGRVTVARPRDAGAGALVLVEPARGDRGGGGGARVLRSIGDPAVALDLLEGLLLDRGLARRFEPQVEHAARAAAERMAEDPGDRHDLRWLATFTIDPPSAGDFDDAISAEALEGEDGWRVWVHIADVAAHVAPGSPVDEEGARRGTSVYVPGLLEPMLPGPLSNEACSLVPGRERPAVTVEMVLKGASVLRAAFHRSLIVSDVRLDYDRVDRIFSGAERAEEPWATPLVVAREAAAALAASRRARGALTVESSEPEFQFDDAGAVVGLAAAAATESHSLIEQLMITANEQVATLLEQRGIPALYRVHERPEPAAMQRLAAQLASLEVATPPLPETLSPSQAEEAAGELSQAVDAHVRRTGRGRRALTSLVLRSLKQARYEPRNLGHAGLRSPRYCHFTSPIRRYPDLVCHRALLSAVGGRGAGARGLRPGRGRRVGVPARARCRPRRARRRRRRPLPAARAPPGHRGLAPELGGRGGRADRGRGVRRLWRRGRVRGVPPRASAARRLVGAQRGGDGAAWGPGWGNGAAGGWRGGRGRTRRRTAGAG